VIPGQFSSVGEVVASTVGVWDGTMLMDGNVLGWDETVGNSVDVVGSAETDGVVLGILLMDGAELGSIEVDGAIDGIVLADGWELGETETDG
jgi:hypothetical protein